MDTNVSGASLIRRNQRMGMTMGEVISVSDPDGLGRVQVQYSLFGSNVKSGWLQVMSFFAGLDHGAIFLPKPAAGDKPGDRALIGFLDNNQAYVLGFIYNEILKPPVESAEKQQDVRVIKTSGGKTLRFDDSESGGIQITDENNNNVQINTGDNSIDITSTGTINLTAKGQLTIKAEQLTLQNTAGTVKLEMTEESLSLTGGGSMKLNADMINLN